MQVETEAEEALKRSENVIETLSSYDTRRITFKWVDVEGQQHEVRYIQAKMGMFHAQEFITMMTRLIKDVIDGKYGVDIISLMKDRERLQSASMSASANEDQLEDVIKEWMPYIQAFLKLTDIVPGLQQDIIALSLGVRSEERKSFKNMISQAPYLGGLEIDETVDILKVFIRQNAKVLRRFLGRQVVEIGQELMEALRDPEEKTEVSSGGTQSSTTTQPIQEPV